MPQARSTRLPPTGGRRKPSRRHTLTLLLLASAGVHAQGDGAAQQAANQQVLDGWQQRTGQQGQLDAQGVVQFQAQVGMDVYQHSVSTELGDARLLSSLREGPHARLSVQADWRRSEGAQTVTWVQGLLNASDDRGVAPRYAVQVANFQVGRGAPGFRMAFGDVVASFSHLSSNLGLRGLQAGWESGRLSAQVFAGTVAESWEALSGRRARDGQAARLQPLRDVIGSKADWRFSPEWSAFLTLQSYADRADAGLSNALRTAATSASLGLRYADAATQAQLEWARARREIKQQAAYSTVMPAQSRDSAWQITLAHRSGDWNWRAGAHDFGLDYTSLAQTGAPGLREGYVGVDAALGPTLAIGAELRDAQTRSASAAFGTGRQQLQTLTQRINWRPAAWPGWSLGLSDSRSLGQDFAGQRSRQAATQFTLGRQWSDGGALQALLGVATQQAAAGAASRSLQWQLQYGRQHTLTSDGSRSLSWQAQAQQQRQTTPAPFASRNLTSSLAVNAGFNDRAWGQWMLNGQWQRMHTRQAGSAAPALDSRSLSLDWTLPATRQPAGFSAKAYVRVQQRNLGDARLAVAERSLGIQGVRQW